MKKIRQILTGVLLIMALSVFTACGNNDMAADEVVEGVSRRKRKLLGKCFHRIKRSPNGKRRGWKDPNRNR